MCEVLLARMNLYRPFKVNLYIELREIWRANIDPHAAKDLFHNANTDKLQMGKSQKSRDKAHSVMAEKDHHELIMEGAFGEPSGGFYHDNTIQAARGAMHGLAIHVLWRRATLCGPIDISKLLTPVRPKEVQHYQMSRARQEIQNTVSQYMEIIKILRQDGILHPAAMQLDFDIATQHLKKAQKAMDPVQARLFSTDSLERITSIEARMVACLQLQTGMRDATLQKLVPGDVEWCPDVRVDSAKGVKGAFRIILSHMKIGGTQGAAVYLGCGCIAKGDPSSKHPRFDNSMCPHPVCNPMLDLRKLRIPVDGDVLQELHDDTGTTGHSARRTLAMCLLIAEAAGVLEVDWDIIFDTFMWVKPTKSGPCTGMMKTYTRDAALYLAKATAIPILAAIWGVRQIGPVENLRNLQQTAAQAPAIREQMGKQQRRRDQMRQKGIFLAQLSDTDDWFDAACSLMQEEDAQPVTEG